MQNIYKYIFAKMCTMLILNLHLTDAQIIIFSMANDLFMFYLRVRL